jgi:hypothetical protein
MDQHKQRQRRWAHMPVTYDGGFSLTHEIAAIVEHHNPLAAVTVHPEPA